MNLKQHKFNEHFIKRIRLLNILIIYMIFQDIFDCIELFCVCSIEQRISHLTICIIKHNNFLQSQIIRTLQIPQKNIYETLISIRIDVSHLFTALVCINNWSVCCSLWNWCFMLFCTCNYECISARNCILWEILEYVEHFKYYLRNHNISLSIYISSNMVIKLLIYN